MSPTYPENVRAIADKALELWDEAYPSLSFHDVLCWAVVQGRKRPRLSGSVDRVRQAAREAYGVKSASVLAAELGVSRNAVIGHWYRLRQAGEIPTAPAPRHGEA